MLEAMIKEPAVCQPNLLAEFFEGNVEAWGLVLTRFGGARRRYRIVMNGFWSGDEFVLEEEFLFDDNEVDRRTWFFTFGNDGSLTTDCDGLKGTGTGVLMRDEFRLDYVFNVPVKQRIIPIRFDDRMFRIDERTMGGHAVMRKFGIRVGELFTLFRR